MISWPEAISIGVMRGWIELCHRITLLSSMMGLPEISVSVWPQQIQSIWKIVQQINSKQALLRVSLCVLLWFFPVAAACRCSIRHRAYIIQILHTMRVYVHSMYQLKLISIHILYTQYMYIPFTMLILLLQIDTQISICEHMESQPISNLKLTQVYIFVFMQIYIYIYAFIHPVVFIDVVAIIRSVY